MLSIISVIISISSENVERVIEPGHKERTPRFHYIRKFHTWVVRGIANTAAGFGRSVAFVLVAYDRKGRELC